MLNRKDFEGRMDDCREMLKNPEEWQKLPLLNTTNRDLLCDGLLVRFEGMIQDMFNPVIFFSEYEVKNEKTGETRIGRGQYNDKIELEEDEVVLFESPKTVSNERKPYYCVSTPGLNDWVEEIHRSLQSSVLEQLQQHQSSVPSGSGSKRCSCDVQEEEQEVSDSSNKRQCLDQVCRKNSELISSSKTQNYSLNLPIKNSKGMGCLVYVYDDEQYKLNTVIEVAGFLSFDPTQVDGNYDGDDVATAIPPLSVVPHLHGVGVNILKHSNPIFYTPMIADDVILTAEYIRMELNSVLRKVLFDDCLAADYIICYLLSSVFSRQNGIALGKFSLNLSNVPVDCDYALLLYKFLSTLVTKSHYLPLTIENLNTLTFLPKKSYETNKLESGLLQLSNNTFLFLDETKLEPGQLQHKGLKNVLALTSVINKQAVDYDFNYYPLEFLTDIPIMILSEGKSMLRYDFHVKMERKENYSKEYIKELFSEEIRSLKRSNLVNTFRVYLTMISSLAYKLSEDLEAQIAEDFVRMRQNIGTTTPQDLHDLLVLARLFSVSRGSTSLTMQTWEMVQEMEQQRKQRLADINLPKK